VWNIENNGVVPSIYRLYSFSVIYRKSYDDLLRLYGVDLAETLVDRSGASAPRSHLTECADIPDVEIPGDLRDTTRLGYKVDRAIRMLFPDCDNQQYSYGYIGQEDRMMAPLLTPGAFVQIDDTSTKVAKGPWRSEYERPIYFVETREGYRCCWCALQDKQLILQPHPLSPELAHFRRYPQEAEVIGQVVGAVLRFPSASRPRRKQECPEETPVSENEQELINAI
jgi:hypothetical protein